MKISLRKTNELLQSTVDALQRETARLKIENEMLRWHRSANDRFLDILGASSREGQFQVSRTTRQHQGDR